ncbi:MFS transporter [Tsukamurella pulmonis]|uniref:MFS transporter n=1 Tax=Tsukamurella pulmonis TaxID=47312 RepID=UPI001EDCB2AF|nr:MFS transporter [Tsukamurella pulmonis]BDD84105.1 MFS transporter [Tsukamurella pulmonis]
MTTHPPIAGAQPGDRAGTTGVLFSMCLALVLVVASVSAINLAMPELAVTLGADNAQLTWIADAYTVALAALVLPLGALGDRLGRRNVLVVGTAVFAVGALFAGLSDSADQLIAWRIVMGLGAAMIMPGTLSTITATFPEEQRPRGVAVWSGFASAGAILGLVGAGAMLEVWSWRSIFYVGAAMAVAAGIAALLLARNTREEKTHRPDLLGALFTTVGIGTLVFAIIEGNETSWTEPIVLASLAVCVVAFAGYAIAGTRTEHPLLDPRLFRISGFRAGGVVVVVQFMALFGFLFVGLQYLQLILGYSPLHSAVALIPVAAVVVPVSLATPRVVDRLGMNVTMGLALVLLAAGFVTVSRMDAGSGYLPFLCGLMIAGVGIGLASSTGTTAIVGSLPIAKQGVASAMNDTTREVGSAIGIALMGAVYSSTYTANLPDLTGLPPEAAETAHESAAGGLAVAERLGTAGTHLADAVRTAFMDGLSASMTVVAVIVAVAALTSFLFAPRRPPASVDAVSVDASTASAPEECAPA